MSRMPPIPSASQPAYGPGSVPKAFTTDLPHPQADLDSPGEDLPWLTQALHPAANRDGVSGSGAVAGVGGAVTARNGGSDTVLLVAFGAVVAAIVWLAGRQRRRIGD